MPVTSEMFAWDDGTGAGELSTVSGNNGFSRKGMDSLYVKSESTGKIIEFCLVESKLHNGELVSYTYKPKDPIYRAKGIKIILFND